MDPFVPSRRLSAPIPTWQEQTLRRGRRSVEAGIAYFMALVGAGWALGRIREHEVRAGLDPLLGLLAQIPFLLLMMLFASSAAIRWRRVPDHVGDRLVVGAAAVTCVMVAELAGGRLIRGWGFYETLANMTTRPGRAFVGLLVAATVMPLLPRRRRRVRTAFGWRPAGDR